MEPSPSEADWIRQIEGLIEEGQCFLAYDRSGQARRDYPDSRHLRLLAILALMRSGGVLEARKILCAMPDALEALEPIANQILADTCASTCRRSSRKPRTRQGSPASPGSWNSPPT
jgi:hypothetical protein